MLVELVSMQMLWFVLMCRSSAQATPCKNNDYIINKCSIEIKTGGHWTTPYNLPQEKRYTMFSFRKPYGKNPLLHIARTIYQQMILANSFIFAPVEVYSIDDMYKGQFTVSKYELGYGVKFQDAHSNKRSNCLGGFGNKWKALKVGFKRLTMKHIKN